MTRKFTSKSRPILYFRIQKQITKRSSSRACCLTHDSICIFKYEISRIAVLFFEIVYIFFKHFRHFFRRASDGLIQKIERLCGLWGYFVGQNAVSAMLVCITLSFVFGVGLLKLDVIYRPYDLWVPKDSEFVQVNMYS